MERAAVSGVFARDPDALLDLIELETTDALLKQEENKASCRVCEALLKRYGYEDKMNEDLSQDDLCSGVAMVQYCGKTMKSLEFKVLNDEIDKASKAVQQRTAWRIDGTLREFPKFAPVNLWFDYPVHKMDESGALQDIKIEDEKPGWKRAMDKRKSPAQKKKERKESIELAFEACGISEKVTVDDLAEYMAVTEKTVRNRLKEHGGFVIEGGEVRKKT